MFYHRYNPIISLVEFISTLCRYVKHELLNSTYKQKTDLCTWPLQSAPMDPTKSLRVGKPIGGHLVQFLSGRGFGPRFLAPGSKVSIEKCLLVSPGQHL